MVLDTLGERLRDGIKNLARKVLLRDSDVEEFLRELQRTLIQADVDVKLVFELTKRIKKRALEEKPSPGLSRREHTIRVVYDELVALLGGEGHKISVDKKPFVIMLVGLFGSGKTTSAGKLGVFFKKKGYKCLLVQTDTWRPAAYEQLEQLSKQTNTDFFGIKKEKDPEKLAQKARELFDKYDVVLVDTAGRDALDEALALEIKKIVGVVSPHETFLVVSADIGQQAREQAEKFEELVGVTGVVVAKMDSTAKAGGALSACSATGAKVKFIGVGEKMGELEEFEPKRFVGRMLGMGDIAALLERAKEAIREEDVEEIEERVLSGKMNFLDLYNQLEAMNKMGPISKIAKMIPGLSMAGLPKEFAEEGEKTLANFKVIMQSMTKEELENPKLLNQLRIKRIAGGSGVSEDEVRGLIKRYHQMNKIVKQLKGKNLERMLKKFQGKGGLPGL